jgi:catechol 2,3-dioxygenase-like lactoylglutathione lyase family enzyme
MSTTEAQSSDGSGKANAGKLDMKLEVIVVPVSDVDRAKEFYRKLGWREDVTPPTVAQFTPPGSACSVQFGANLTSAAPGSVKRTYLVVSDIDAALAELAAAGIKVDNVFHFGPDFKPVPGVDPEHRSYSSRAEFSDPDGNTWMFQEITTRLPGRVDAADTSYSSANDLANAMRRASIAHGEHEKRIGEADANWPDWYASYMVAEAHGAELPT